MRYTERLQEVCCEDYPNFIGITQNATRQPKNGLNTGAGNGNRTECSAIVDKWLVYAVR